MIVAVRALCMRNARRTLAAGSYLPLRKTHLASQKTHHTQGCLIYTWGAISRDTSVPLASPARACARVRGRVPRNETADELAKMGAPGVPTTTTVSGCCWSDRLGLVATPVARPMLSIGNGRVKRPWVAHTVPCCRARLFACRARQRLRTLFHRRHLANSRPMQRTLCGLEGFLRRRLQSRTRRGRDSARSLLRASSMDKLLLRRRRPPL